MKKIILIITGSIAAPKALALYNLLKEKYQVTVIASPSANKFVKFPETIKVYHQFLEQDFYHKDDKIVHTDFALNSDLIVVYPATMTFISKVAVAIVDNLALATILASDKPKIIFPAMNHNMYHNQGLQNNLAILEEDYKIKVVGTDKGMLACRIVGDGRVKEPDVAFKMIEEYQTINDQLINKTVLINFGASRTYFDDFRYLTTNSSGKMGQALVKAFLARNAKVIAVVGDVSIPLLHDKNLTIIRANTNETILKNMKQYFNQVDIVISAAALNDYQFEESKKGKISKSENQQLQVKLIPNIDVLATLGKAKTKQLLIGFSAQDNEDVMIGKKKMEEKNCDGIIINHIETMANNETKVKFYFQTKVYHFQGTKIKVAQEIVQIISANIK